MPLPLLTEGDEGVGIRQYIASLEAANSRMSMELQATASGATGGWPSLVHCGQPSRGGHNLDHVPETGAEKHPLHPSREIRSFGGSSSALIGASGSTGATGVTGTAIDRGDERALAQHLGRGGPGSDSNLDEAAVSLRMRDFRLKMAEAELQHEVWYA